MQERQWRFVGFFSGEVTGEHWLGNDNVFLLTNQAEYMLRVDLYDFYDSRVYSEYRMFKLDGERDGYRLNVANYSGNARSVPPRIALTWGGTVALWGCTFIPGCFRTKY